VINPDIWIKHPRAIKIDGTIKKIVRKFRRFFKNAFERKHQRKFYGWISNSFRQKAKEFLFSYNISAITKEIYNKNEGQFIFFLYSKFGTNENKKSKKIIDK
jgi:hypothetical protein